MKFKGGKGKKQEAQQPLAKSDPAYHQSASFASVKELLVEPDNLRDVYENFASAVAYVAVQRPDGIQSIGTAFHVGEGIFITARHVVQNCVITSIATTERALEFLKGDESSGVRTAKIKHWPGEGQLLNEPYYHPDEDVDVAALRVEGIDAPIIPLGDHLDDWLGTELVLQDVVVLGYPPIPFSRTPILVASRAEVNAIVDKYTGGHPHFILSTVARGGFSGGPAITSYGCSLGVITESLGVHGQPPELGYLAVLSVEPIYACLSHHRIVPLHIDEQWEGFWNTESVDYTDDSAPQGWQHVSVEFYPGPRQRYIEVYCHNTSARNDAIKAATSGLTTNDYKVEWIHDWMLRIVYGTKYTEDRIRPCFQDVQKMMASRFK